MKALKKFWNFYSFPIMAFSVIVLAIYIGYSVEMWRWHTFQSVTHSDISFLKWQFLFGGGKH